MLPVTEQLKSTPLEKEHVRLGAKMVPFGGWNMPVQYEGILAEHAWTRQSATIFDTCHMGEFFLYGDPDKNGFNRLVTQSLTDLPVKSCRYGLLLNESGGVLDDLIVYRLEPEAWMVVVNASTIERDAKQFRQHLTPTARFENASTRLGKLDIQGPTSREVLKPIVPGIEKLQYYTFDSFEVLGEKVVVSRTGYTGELGFEIYFPWNKIPQLWQTIMKNPTVKPAGLGARDVLRLEMGYSLYGHELSESINPLEAGLGKFINWEKDFIGKNALLNVKESGTPRKLVAFCSQSRRSPRQHHLISTLQGEVLGEVTSGTFSPSLNQGIGMGFVKTAFAKIGEKVCIGKENATMEGIISSRPFFKSGSIKN